MYTAVAAFLVGTLSVLFNVADTAALRFLVPAPQVSSAVVQLQARENAAWLVGGPLGGFLFGLGRALPFLFDGVSYLIGVVTTLLIRLQFQGDRAEQSRGVFREMWHGLRFVITLGRGISLIPASFADEYRRPGLAFVRVEGIADSAIALAWKPYSTNAPARRLAQLAAREANR